MVVVMKVQRSDVSKQIQPSRSHVTATTEQHRGNLINTIMSSPPTLVRLTNALKKLEEPPPKHPNQSMKIALDQISNNYLTDLTIR